MVTMDLVCSVQLGGQTLTFESEDAECCWSFDGKSNPTSHILHWHREVIIIDAALQGQVWLPGGGA